MKREFRTWIGLLLLLGLAFAIILVHSATTSSAQGNSGDAWVDNVGQPPGPGHENDPHLECADINLWGNGLSETSGTFTIASWSPTGNGATAYGPADWKYDVTLGGDQVMAVIPITTLLEGSAANHDVAQPQQGLHFKLQFVQDPQKHKTFWVNCETPTPTPTPTPTATPTPTPTPTTSPSTTPTPTHSPTPTPTQSPTPTPSHSPTPTPTASPTPTSTPTATPTPTGSVSPTATATGSPSPSPSGATGTLAGTGGGPSSGAGRSVPIVSLFVLLIGCAFVVTGRLLRR